MQGSFYCNIEISGPFNIAPVLFSPRLTGRVGRSIQVVSHRRPFAAPHRQRDQELLEHAPQEAAPANGHRPRDAQIYRTRRGRRPRQHPPCASPPRDVIHSFPHLPVGMHTRRGGCPPRPKIYPNSDHLQRGESQGDSRRVHQLHELMEGAGGGDAEPQLRSCGDRQDLHQPRQPGKVSTRLGIVASRATIVDTRFLGFWRLADRFHELQHRFRSYVTSVYYPRNLHFAVVGADHRAPPSVARMQHRQIQHVLGVRVSGEVEPLCGFSHEHPSLPGLRFLVHQQPVRERQLQRRERRLSSAKFEFFHPTTE